MGNSKKTIRSRRSHGFRIAILKNRAFALSPVLSVYPIRVISAIRG